MKGYIPAGELIKKTYSETVSHYKSLLPYFRWLLALSIILIVLFAIDPEFSNPFIVFLVAFTYVGYVLYSIWVNVVLPRAVAEVITKNKIHHDDVIKNVWWIALSTIILSIGISLIIITGYLILIIPGIYLMILLSFAKYRLIIDGGDVMESIATSAKIVHGRWWKVFWRWLVSGIVIMVSFYAVLFVVDKIFILSGAVDATWTAGAMLLVSSLLMPFLVVWSVTHYLSARDSIK